MAEKIDLKGIKERSVRSSYEDGLWDIMMGFLLLAPGIAPVFAANGEQRMLVYFTVFLTGMAIFALGKRYFSAPRIGRVKIRRSSSAGRRILVVFLFMAVILTISLVIMTISYKTAGMEIPFSSALGGMAIPVGAGLFAMIIIGGVAYQLKINRIYVYALMFGFSIIGAELLYNTVGSPLDGLLTFGLTGTIIALNGLVLFARFVKKYPKEA